MMQLSFQFEPMTPPKDMAHRLRMAANVLEGVEPKTAAKVENTTAAEKPAKKGKQKQKQEPEAEEQLDFDLDADAAADETDEETDDDTTPEITYESLASAFQAFAKRNSKEAAFGVLKKLKVKSIKEIKPEQYAKAMSMVE